MGQRDNKNVVVPQWEYRIVPVDTNIVPLKQEDELSDLGADGWELCGVVPVTWQTTAAAKLLFKRPAGYLIENME